jgi:hypothetical protein
VVFPREEFLDVAHEADLVPTFGALENCSDGNPHDIDLQAD